MKVFWNCEVQSYQNQYFSKAQKDILPILSICTLKFLFGHIFFFLPLDVLLVHLQMTVCAAARWAEKNTGKQTVHGGYSSTQGEATGIQIHRHTDTYIIYMILH